MLSLNCILNSRKLSFAALKSMAKKVGVLDWLAGRRRDKGRDRDRVGAGTGVHNRKYV
jgi:hypothetical protein